MSGNETKTQNENGTIVIKRTGYNSEKIARNAAQKIKTRDPIATFNKMRKLTMHGYKESYLGGDRNRSNYGVYFTKMVRGSIFYKQAVYMEKFSDYYEGSFMECIGDPVYNDLTNEQLRTYFTWRTNVRKSEVTQVSTPYYYIYLNELINNVGVNGAEDGIEKMIYIWLSFRQYDNRIDKLSYKFICDYYVLYKIGKPFEELSKNFPEEILQNDFWADLISEKKFLTDIRIAEKSSSHKITEGQFYKKRDKKLIEKCFCYIFVNIDKLFENNSLNFINLFSETVTEFIGECFDGSIYSPRFNLNRKKQLAIYSGKLNKYVTIMINDTLCYKRYPKFNVYDGTIGFILKTIESKMRTAFGFKSGLKPPEVLRVKKNLLASEGYRNINVPLTHIKEWKKKTYSLIRRKEFERTIDKAIQDFMETEKLYFNEKGELQKIQKVKPIKIDMSRLDKIREEHSEIEEKLVIEDYSVYEKAKEQDREEKSDTAAEVFGWSGFIGSLDKSEIMILKLLVDKADVSEIKKAATEVGTLPEIIIEKINEKALRAVDDNVIDTADGEIYIYDDYLKELEGI